MEDLTTGSISRHLLRTTSFMLVTMVFQTLCFLVDLYWVGRLGKEAIAGVQLTLNLLLLRREFRLRLAFPSAVAPDLQRA